MCQWRVDLGGSDLIRGKNISESEKTPCSLKDRAESSEPPEYVKAPGSDE